MAGSGQGGALRAATGELISTYQVEDNAGDTSAARDLELGIGADAEVPARWTKIAHKTSTVSLIYPPQGDGVLDGGGATPTIDASIDDNYDFKGIGIYFTDGNAAGQWRILTNYVGNTSVCTPHRGFTSNPTTGDHYILFVPLLGVGDLILSSYFSSVTAGQKATGYPIFLALPRDLTASQAAVATPIGYANDVPLIFDGLGNTLPQTYVPESSYYYGTTKRARHAGAWGGLFYLQSVDAGSVSLYAKVPGIPKAA